MLTANSKLMPQKRYSIFNRVENNQSAKHALQMPLGTFLNLQISISISPPAGRSLS
jgi:hypothetical protein